METFITDTEGRAISDTNETRHAKQAAARAQALKCLQEMCAKEHGILTITPRGWNFGFPHAIKSAPLSAWIGHKS